MLPEASRGRIPTAGSTSGSPCPTASNAKAMLPRAVTERVAYAPGTGFFADGTGHRYARLSYCYPDPDRIREGVRRFSGVVRSELELIETFGTAAGSAPGSDGSAPSVQMPGPDSF